MLPVYLAKLEVRSRQSTFKICSATTNYTLSINLSTKVNCLIHEI